MRELLFIAEKAASGALLAILSVTIFVQVVSRAFLDLPLAWSEEVSRYSFIWLTMVAAPLCVRMKANIGMDALARHLPPRGAQLLELIGYLVTIVLAAVMLVWGIAILDVVKAQRSPAMGIPMYWIYAAIPVGGALIMVELVALLRAAIRRTGGPSAPSAPGGPSSGGGA